MPAVAPSSDAFRTQLIRPIHRSDEEICLYGKCGRPEQLSESLACPTNSKSCLARCSANIAFLRRTTPTRERTGTQAICSPRTEMQTHQQNISSRPCYLVACAARKPSFFPIHPRCCDVCKIKLKIAWPMHKNLEPLHVVSRLPIPRPHTKWLPSSSERLPTPTMINADGVAGIVSNVEA